ncbi:MAG: Bug family tripartite tricarboxylate transporter substrate binding protein [Chloroflexota bacterium]
MFGLSRRLPVFLIVLVVLSLLASCAPAAPAYPTKTINMIIPLAAGGGPDATFRVLASEAEKHLGQKIAIINRAGPGGTVGVGELVQAAPDGYTIGMAAVAMLNIQPYLQDVPFKGPEDVMPIVQADEAPMVLYVKADSPHKTLKDFVDAAKKDPGKITVGNVGGSYNIPHVDLVLFEKLAGVKLNIVPYGTADHTPAVLGGTIVASTGQVAAMTQFVKAGQVRALGVFLPQRSPALPDVPTFKEQGYDVVEAPYEFVIAPKGISKEVKDKLVDAFAKAAQSQAFKEYGAKSGVVVSFADNATLTKKLSDDAAKYKKMIDDAGWKKS